MYPPKNVKMSNGLSKILKSENPDDKWEHGSGLKKQINRVGQPLNKDSITFTFSNVHTLFLECQKINDTYINCLQTKILCAISVAKSLDGSVTANLQHPVIAAYRNNFVKELTFGVHDEHGNGLQIKKALLRFTINGECISRQNLP